jgi:AraC-like DNA-binding protein
MDISLDWKNIIYLFSQFIGYSVGLVLITSGLKGKKSNIFLGLNFLFLTYSTFIIWLITTGYFVKFPALYRTGNLTGLLFIPLMYLYIRREIGKKPFSPFDFLHLLPALVFFIDFWPIYNLPVDQKLSLIKSEISNPALFTQFSQSRFFHANFYTPFRTLLNLVYWSLSVYWVFKGSKNQVNKKFSKEWFIWIKIFLGFQSMVFLPVLFLYWVITPLTAYLMAHLSIVVLNIGTGFALLFLPKLLYGLDHEQFEKKPQTRKSKTEILDQLSEKKIAEIRNKIDTALHVEKKYLQQGYSINDLSNDTGIPSYLLTLYINNTLSTSFPDLINKERIEECCKMMASGEYAHFATEGFANLCGFSNRNTFSLAFRKYKDLTPSAYLKKIRS